jgi:hypothetical protein
MVFVLLGLGIGLALALAASPVPALIGPVDAVSGWLLDAGHRLVSAALELTGLPADGLLLQVLAMTLGAMVPGLVCLVLMTAARAAAGARRAVAGVLLVAALATFAILPAGQALLLVVVALAVSALLSLATGTVLVLPMVAVATVLGTRTVMVVLGGSSVEVTGGADLLSQLSGLDPALWRVALAIVAVAPIAGAARLLRRSR